MDVLFKYCCNFIHYIADIFNISYAACNVLLFLDILPLLVIVNTILVLIFGFYKKSKLFGVFCIIGAWILAFCEIEAYMNRVFMYQSYTECFNDAVETLKHLATYYNTSYEVINIVCLIIIPIFSIGLKTLLIISNNDFSKYRK